MALDSLPPERVAQKLLDAELAGMRVVRRQARALGQAATLVAAALAAGGRLIYAGAGTSGRLGALDAAELGPTFGLGPDRAVALLAGGRAALSHAVEGAEDRAEDAARQLHRLRPGPADVLVAVSASGVTPYTRAALDAARSAGARTLLVTCAPDPSHRDLCDLVVGLPVGPELLTGSTRLKAGTATKLALNAISTGALIQLGAVYEGQMVALQATNRKLTLRARRIVSALCGVPEPAAGRLLARAGGQVKLAVAMGWIGGSRKKAEAALTDVAGDLRKLKAKLS